MQQPDRLDATELIVRAEQIGTSLDAGDRSVLAMSLVRAALKLDSSAARWALDKRPWQ